MEQERKSIKKNISDKFKIGSNLIEKENQYLCDDNIKEDYITPIKILKNQQQQKKKFKGEDYFSLPFNNFK